MIWVIRIIEIIFFLSDYVKGGDFYHHNYVKKTYFEEENLKFYMAEICHAIYNLHQSGIIHRDLNLEIILLDCLRRNVKNRLYANVSLENEYLVHCSTPF